jgi:hypothetical protein
MDRECMNSFTLSSHGLSGTVCQNGMIIAALSLERISRVKNVCYFQLLDKIWTHTGGNQVLMSIKRI